MERVSSLPGLTDDERAVRCVIETWMRATKEGDVGTVMGLMADDVIFLVPGQAPFGKEAFALALQGMERFRFDGTSRVREIQIMGDWAFGWTDLVVIATPVDGGEAVRRSGNTLSIFKRLADGRWVLARDANLLTPEKSDASN